jgi:hypothetical protein
MRRLLLLALVAGCAGGSAADDGGADDADAGESSTACTEEGATRCMATIREHCTGGAWTVLELCPTACDDALGCVDCIPADGRTCIANNVRECTDEGLIGAVVETCDTEHPCIDGACGGCAARTELIHLLDAGAHLYGFDPRTLVLEDVGAIDCPTAASDASPYSMAVDRRGQAWVLFDDGEIFWVDIADASCRTSGFVPDQDEFHTFGMGFVSESPGGAETLYVAGGPDIGTAVGDTRLGTIDTLTLAVTAVAPLTVLDAYYPELSGDGAGGLYAYFPSTTYPSRISTLRRDTARIGPTWDAVRVDATDQIVAWAFARWGGAFYVFVTIQALGSPPTGSEIYRLDPATGELTFLLYDYRTWVGAGVSTCAPILI